MAKIKKEKTTVEIEKPKLDDFEKELSALLEKQTGAGLINLASRDFVPYYIDTGNYALNWIISHKFVDGGLPATKIIIIEGENSTGKSLLVFKLLAQNIVDAEGKNKKGLSIEVDTEDASNHQFVKQILDDSELADKIKRSDDISTIEQLNKFINQVCDFSISKKKDAQVMIGVDSFSQLSSEKEVKTAETKYNSAKDDPRDMTKAVKAREGFRVINTKLFDANTTLVYAVHITKNIGVMFGDPNVPATHGSALLYASSLRLRITSSSDIKSDKFPIPIGVRMKVKTIKNRVKHRGKKCEIDMYFKGGVSRYSGLVKLLVEFKIVNGPADPTNTSKIQYVDDQGEEHSFKAGDIEEFCKKNKHILGEWETRLNKIVDFEEGDLGNPETSEDSEEEFPSEVYNEE